jgi:predicted kinase
MTSPPVAPLPAPLRCHLLIGPPASGKTTLAGVLAQLTGAVVLSTDVVRGELFGDAAIQGPWRDIEALLHQRLREAVAAGTPVILDATHARRPWRLAITQALSLPVPVEWIGWWLYTPLSTCLQWNQTRKRLVPEPVIREMAAALADPAFGPSRAEGFAAVVAVVPTHGRELEALLRDELARLDHRIRSARNREKRFQLHGYSRLLDLERLLHLLRLLTSFPELSAADPATRAELEAIVSPLPEGDLAEQAAAYLRRLHGECFGDASAIRNDLTWLEANGFCSAEPALAPIQLAPPQPEPPATGPWPGGVNGGFPPMGDGPVFMRVFTLLRHLLQQPFDQAGGVPLPEHLIERTEAIPGSYLPSEAATLRKDLEKLLTPYGFRHRNDNVRHGYAIGTALLSAHRLREIHGVVSQASRPAGRSHLPGSAAGAGAAPRLGRHRRGRRHPGAGLRQPLDCEHRPGAARFPGRRAAGRGPGDGDRGTAADRAGALRLGGLLCGQPKRLLLGVAAAAAVPQHRLVSGVRGRRDRHRRGPDPQRTDRPSGPAPQRAGQPAQRRGPQPGPAASGAAAASQRRHLFRP